jgi:hypothetical protein
MMAAAAIITALAGLVVAVRPLLQRRKARRAASPPTQCADQRAKDDRR